MRNCFSVDRQNKQRRGYARPLSCFVTILFLSSSNIIASEIPGTDADTIPLSTAYHSEKSGFFGFQAATGNTSEDYGNTSGEVVFSVDTDFKTLSNMVNGSLDAGFSGQTVSVNAGGSYASENAADEFTASYTLYASLKPKKRVLVPLDENGYQPTTVALEWANSYPDNLKNRLGDEFVTAIEYGSYLLVNMKVEFKSAEDKTKLGGYLDVDVSGVASVSGDLSKVDEDVKRSVKITLTAKQVGGLPDRLIQIIPDQLVECTLNNPTPCFSVFEAAVAYMHDDYVNQLSSLDRYNAVKVSTSKYIHSGYGMVQLTSENDDTMKYLTKLTLQALYSQFEDSILEKRRASNILTYYSADLTEDQKELIRDIENSARSNAGQFSNLIAYCKRNPLGDLCVDRYQYVFDNGFIDTYDVSKLDLSNL